MGGFISYTVFLDTRQEEPLVRRGPYEGAPGLVPPSPGGSLGAEGEQVLKTYRQ